MSTIEEQWRDGPSLLESLWRYKETILAVAVAAALLGYLLSLLQDPVYEASARLYLEEPALQQVVGEVPRGIDALTFVPQQQERITSRPVLEATSRLLDERLSPAQIAERVETSSQPELLTITITAEGDDPESAARLATAVAEAYQEVQTQASIGRADEAIAQLSVARDEIEQDLEELQQRLVASPENPVLADQVEGLIARIGDLDSRIEELRVNAVFQGSGVALFETATLPNVPSAPRPLINAILTGVLGFALASAWAYWQAGRSQRVESRGDAAQVLQVPLLGEVPRYRVNRNVPLARQLELPPVAAESYQFVLTSIEYALSDLGGTSLLVTSAAPGQGKTSTAVQLALAASRDGRRVVAVDADVRMQGLSRYLEVPDARGLTTLAATDLDVADVVLPLEAGGTTLPVVPAGPHVEDPSVFFRLPSFRKAMQRVRNEAELVVVDASPLLAVADTIAMAGQVDGIVIVIEHGADLAQLEQMRERFAFVSTPILGYVYNRAPSTAVSTYGYTASTK